MNNYAWIKKAYITIFIVFVCITVLVGLLIGKVVEATLFKEILKWAIIAIIVGALACLILTPFVAIFDNVRDKLYPEFGKKWFFKWVKNGFKVSINEN